VIIRKNKWHMLTCDICGKQWKFSSWEEAFQYALTAGFGRLGKGTKECKHFCPDCSEP
jgi:hypothetical protein